MKTTKKTNASWEENFLPCLQIGKLLTSTLNLNEILQLIMEKITQLVQADNWSLLLKEEDIIPCQLKKLNATRKPALLPGMVMKREDKREVL